MDERDAMVADDGAGDRPLRRSPHLMSPRNWPVAAKLWLAFGLLIAILAASGVVARWHIQQIDADLIQIVAVEEPLEQAVLEMEINVGETAAAVFQYVRELAPEHIEAMRDSEADFERFAAAFERLAETDEERRLGREVARLYAEFKELGTAIVALAEQQDADLRRFRTDVEKIDELIDEKLQKSIDRGAPDALVKLEAALDMEINIDEAFAAIEGYVLRPSAVLRRKVLDAEADFERFEALYRQTPLSADETRWLDRIEGDFTDARAAGDRIMTVTDRLNTRLEDFEQHLVKIDAILDDEIQPLIHAETLAAAADAKTSTDRAALILLILGAIAVAVAAHSGVSRQTTVPSLSLRQTNWASGSFRPWKP